MKQSNTINNEIIRFLNNITGNDAVNQRKTIQHKPGKHVVNNILNYARAMSVLQRENGQAFILLMN